MTADLPLELLDDLERAGADWLARCPACSSAGALRVHVNVRGFAELTCAAGCSLADVLDAIERRRQRP